jgi:Na+-driven multidrug efflux pump
MGIKGVFFATNIELLVPAALFYLRFNSGKWLDIEV